MDFTAPQALRATLFLVGITLASSAFAHAHLQRQEPAADAQVTSSPQALTLNFSENIEEKFSGVTVSGPQQDTVATAPATLNAQDQRQLIVQLIQPLAAGEYTVDWHVVSVDGHKTQGQYHFTVK